MRAVKEYTIVTKFLSVLLMLLSSAALAQPIGGSGSGTEVTATGTTTARTLASRATDIGVNVMDYGAMGDGVTDDAPAFTLAMSAFQTKLAAQQAANQGAGISPYGGAATFKIPPGQYMIKETLNWTGVQTRGVMIDATGATLIGETNGYPIIDLYASASYDLHGLTLLGATTRTPSIGIQAGRSTTVSCGSYSWSQVFITGSYSFTGAYVQGCETSMYTNFRSYNRGTSTGTYALYFDAFSTKGITSQFVTAQSPGTGASMDEVVLINAILSTVATDSASYPLHISHSENLRFINAYAAGNSVCNIEVDVGASTAGGLDSIQKAQLDIHTESGNGSLQYEFCLDGTQLSPILDGWKYSTQVEHAPTAVYHILTAGMNPVMRQSVAIETPVLGSGVPVFAEPSQWTVSGEYSIPQGEDTQWNLTCNANWYGTGIAGTNISYCGNGAGLSGVSVTLPSTLVASQVANTGGVTALTLNSTSSPHGGQYHYSAGIPAISISAPTTAGGATATATSLMGIYASAPLYTDGYSGFATGGTGYLSSDTLTLVGGTCSTQPKIGLVTVTGGVAYSWYSSTEGVCSVYPAEPISLSGGHGSGATLSGTNWAVTATTLTSPGSGYVTPPSVTFTYGGSQSSTAVAAAQISAILTLIAGGGQIVLNQWGATVGTNGSAGLPLITAGALLDASGVAVPVALSTSGYTLPANVSRQRFRPTGTVSAATITLPTPSVDNFQLALVLYGNIVTALTFSPAVQGWTNASTWSANTTIRMAWDVTAGAWVQEQ
jgi:hypothetical protein